MEENKNYNVVSEEDLDDTAEEMPDAQFENWLTLGKEFSNEFYRSDETMQKMMIMTKISQAHLDTETVESNIEDITSIIRDNIKSLIGKHFKIVYIDDESDLALYANVLFRKNIIALIGAR